MNMIPTEDLRVQSDGSDHYHNEHHSHDGIDHSHTHNHSHEKCEIKNHIEHSHDDHGTHGHRHEVNTALTITDAVTYVSADSCYFHSR